MQDDAHRGIRAASIVAPTDFVCISAIQSMDTRSWTFAVAALIAPPDKSLLVIKEKGELLTCPPNA